MFGMNDCQQTVSILKALLRGADGACIDVGPSSLIGGIALFMACVVALRFVGSWFLRRAFASLRSGTKEPSGAPESDRPDELQRVPYESPIQSTGAWGSRNR